MSSRILDFLLHTICKWLVNCGIMNAKFNFITSPEQNRLLFNEIGKRFSWFSKTSNRENAPNGKVSSSDQLIPKFGNRANANVRRFVFAFAQNVVTAVFDINMAIYLFQL